MRFPCESWGGIMIIFFYVAHCTRIDSASGFALLVFLFYKYNIFSCTADGPSAFSLSQKVWPPNVAKCKSFLLLSDHFVYILAMSSYWWYVGMWVDHDFICSCKTEPVLWMCRIHFILAMTILRSGKKKKGKTSQCLLKWKKNFQRSSN